MAAARKPRPITRAEIRVLNAAKEYVRKLNLSVHDNDTATLERAVEHLEAVEEAAKAARRKAARIKKRKTK